MSRQVQPSLCIIVPTFNSFHLLPDLVNSLTAQDSPFWSVLFVDGDSSSEHRQWLIHICSSDSRFSWTSQPPDQPGIYGAMNFGFQLTHDYDWVLFWGSDDHAYVLIPFRKFSQIFLHFPALIPILLLIQVAV